MHTQQMVDKINSDHYYDGSQIIIYTVEQESSKCTENYSNN